MTHPFVVASPAHISRQTELEEGDDHHDHALVNAGASIGRNCIINTKALIEHDAVSKIIATLLLQLS